jgi:hypothetical protein
MLRVYERITGFSETDPMLILQHKISMDPRAESAVSHDERRELDSVLRARIGICAGRTPSNRNWK